jgi:hypothetical protein
MLARPHGFDRYNTEEEEMVKAVLAKQRGRRLGMKQGDTRAAQVSA